MIETSTIIKSEDILSSTTGISFWGGIDPLTGNVIDISHPLHGQCISSKILCIPSGRGSCTGSQVMLELILNGKAPRAIILRDVDLILCTGAIIAQEFFGDEVGDDSQAPIICAVGEENFSKLISDNNTDGSHSISIEVLEDGNIYIHQNNDSDERILTKDLLKIEDVMLDYEEDSHTSTKSPAEILAFNVIKRIASISGTKELIPITNGHIDAVTYIGPSGLRFVQKLVELGGQVKVPTTLNSQSCDRRKWQSLGVNNELATNANAVGDAYLDLGCQVSFTCAPYLLPNKPTFGEDIIWGESNAVVYSNSVIGARTEKYADYFDICAAICGCVPKSGVHIEENRMPTIVIDATKLIEDHVLSSIRNNDDGGEKGFDSFFPAMGWLCGNLSDGRIPIILGFDTLPSVSNDNMKAFCAAYGTTGTSPLFHMANVTPEAMGDDTIDKMLYNCGGRKVEVTKEDLCKAYETLDSGNDGSVDISLVALGNPHLSVGELDQLSKLIDRDDRPKHKDIKVIATIGRHVQSKGTELGFTQKLTSFGVQFINDTCWCMLLDPPIIPPNINAKILTNSGKYSHYGPGLTNRKLRFGSMFDCVEAAKTGKITNRKSSVPRWLRSFSTQQVVHSIRYIK